MIDGSCSCRTGKRDNSALRPELGLREDVLARYARTRVGVWQARALTSQSVRKGVAIGAQEGNDNSGTKQERATPDHASNDNERRMRMQRPRYRVNVRIWIRERCLRTPKTKRRSRASG